MASAPVPASGVIAPAPLSVHIEGSIEPAAPPAPPAERIQGISHTHTLDEPVLTTIARDLRRVGTKLRVVLAPGASQTDALKELRDWDLWGPLLLCLVLSIILSMSAPINQASLVFASVFIIVWAGAGIVTLNAKLLGGNVSFFQSVCVLGYCIFPLVIAAFLCFLWRNSIFRTLVVSGSLVWAMRASVVFMSEMVAASRRALALFPVSLFYVVIAWLVYVQK